MRDLIGCLCACMLACVSVVGGEERRTDWAREVEGAGVGPGLRAGRIEVVNRTGSEVLLAIEELDGRGSRSVPALKPGGSHAFANMPNSVFQILADARLPRERQGHRTFELTPTSDTHTWEIREGDLRDPAQLRIAGGDLAVRVRSTAGNAVPGATVRIAKLDVELLGREGLSVERWDEEKAADGRGCARFSNWQVGKAVRVEVAANGFAPGVVDVRPSAHVELDTRSVFVTLSPEVAVRHTQDQAPAAPPAAADDASSPTKRLGELFRVGDRFYGKAFVEAMRGRKEPVGGWCVMGMNEKGEKGGRLIGMDEKKALSEVRTGMEKGWHKDAKGLQLIFVNQDGVVEKTHTFKEP